MRLLNNKVQVICRRYVITVDLIKRKILQESRASEARRHRVRRDRSKRVH